MPILGCMVLFFIVDKMQIHFKYKLVITFASIVCVLTFLEIGEYIFDFFWDFRLQGVYVRDIAGLEKYKIILGRNDDTMIDLMLGVAGSILFGIGKTFHYLYNKWYSKSSKLRVL